MTGFNSKRQMAQDRLAEMLDLCDYLEGNDASLEAQCKAAAFIREALAQPAQGPVDNDFFKVLARNNPSPDHPRNFCPRCGKRRGGDVNYIHTCTPPRGLEMT
jgi:hypothetical protein